MSEQPERIEAWAVTDGKSISKLGREIDARETAKSLGGEYREVRLTERRDGETIVGPLEMAVIEAAKQIIAEWDERNVPPGTTSAGRQCMESAIGALREARR